MDLDRKAIRKFSGSDQHAAITTSITTSFAISIRLVRVCSYRDGGRELFSIVFGAIGMKIMSRQRRQGSLHLRAFEARPVSSTVFQTGHSNAHREGCARTSCSAPRFSFGRCGGMAGRRAAHGDAGGECGAPSAGATRATRRGGGTANTRALAFVLPFPSL